ncbi:MAG: hypothetical protein NTW29_06275 [Bacteroidetes bacterium]|nr:hypothetical protein [Bacteroidota bacterium]
MATLQQLRDEYLRLSQPDNIEDCIDALDRYCNFFLSAIKNHQTENNTSAQDIDAKIIMQMMMTKALHIKSAINGVEFDTKKGVKLNKIIDPTIIASLIRNVYEMAAMFNLIYRTNKQGDERDIVYKLWVISGLKYRQRFSVHITTQENQVKLKSEDEIIKDYIREIEATYLYKSISEKDKVKIKRLIDDNYYLMQFEGNRVKVLHWQALIETMKCKQDFFQRIYTYFSLYSHPSNVSVFQFRDMFMPDENSFIFTTTFNMKYVFMLLSIFIADYITLFPQVLKTFNNLDLMDQLIINNNNIFARDYFYSINDSWKELG